MFAINGRNLTCCRVESGFVVTRVIGDVYYAEKSLGVGSSCGVLKDRVYLR